MVKIKGSSHGDHVSKDILMIAAGLLQEGKWVEKDSVHAAVFYTWRGMQVTAMRLPA
ncbi:hypothetical protein [Pantoea stewartii]|uniref:hypothetical protein n=1 Tax=Pantoea stewartii TaxID=66269 RepID=UPI001980CC95|nr:hypothetical protein [Pantoea stewartii]